MDLCYPGLQVSERREWVKAPSDLTAGLSLPDSSRLRHTVHRGQSQSSILVGWGHAGNPVHSPRLSKEVPQRSHRPLEMPVPLVRV